MMMMVERRLFILRRFNLRLEDLGGVFGVYSRGEPRARSNKERGFFMRNESLFFRKLFWRYSLDSCRKGSIEDWINSIW